MSINDGSQDPRLEVPTFGERDIRPVVTPPRSGVSNMLLIGIAFIAAIALFLVLNARRSMPSAQGVTATLDTAYSSAPPPLNIPEAAIPVEPPPPSQAILAPTVDRSLQIIPRQPSFRARSLGYESAYTAAPDLRASLRNAQIPSGSPLEHPAPQDDPRIEVAGKDVEPPAKDDTVRVRATTLANRTMTVPQGSMISAVLETAFDSTMTGFARALVQHDVRGFDGTTVLIPRGSRLLGEYGADTAAGQRRAKIAWTRLIRPDGVTIALNSPATDTLGRGGVHASVDSHFFERFSGAILQTSLDVGANLAARNKNGAVVVALPGSIQTQSSSILSPSQVKPTLTIPPGTSISVFVARDLDFTGTSAN